MTLTYDGEDLGGVGVDVGDERGHVDQQTRRDDVVAAGDPDFEEAEELVFAGNHVRDEADQGWS